MKRQRVVFWLNLQRNDEAVISLMVAELKQGRVFMRAIRDGITIMYDLLHGRTDELLRLYPWVFDAIRDMPPHRETELREQLARLEQLMLAQPVEQGRAVDAPQRQLPPKPTAPAPVVKADESSSETFFDQMMGF